MTAEQWKIDRKHKIVEYYNNQSIEKIAFIGIDRSLTSSGIAIVNKGKLIEQIEYKTKSYEEDRLISIGSKVLQVCWHYKEKKYNVLICMENYSYNSRGHVFQLGELGGVIKTFIAMKGYNFLDIEPTVLKKYITGKGNSPKDLIPMHVNKKFNIVPVGGDAADAIGCAMLGFHAFNDKKNCGKYTQVEKDVFETFLQGKKKKKRKSIKAKNRQLELEINE